MEHADQFLFWGRRLGHIYSSIKWAPNWQKGPNIILQYVD